MTPNPKDLNLFLPANTCLLISPRDRQPEPGRQVVAHVKFALLDYLSALAFGQTREVFAIKGLSEEFSKFKNTVVKIVGADLARGIIGLG
jgi:hypothetical protein